MEDINNIADNPLLKGIHEHRRIELKEKFSELKNSSQVHYLSLYKYLKQAPQCFYSESAYKTFFAWLNDRDRTNQLEFQKYFVTNEVNLSRSILYLEEINNYDWHDSFENIDDYEGVRFIDQRIHPTYLRLVEGVFKSLCHIIAYFSRIDRKKGTEGLDLFSITQEIEKTVLLSVIEPYKRTVRNAIAHGGVTYLQKEIKYHDNSGNKEKYSHSEIIRIFDDLLDICNALVLSLTLFLLSHQEDGYKLPQQILIEELKEETRSPWWEIVGCTPSAFDHLNQLLIYARPRTFDYNKVVMSTIQSAILAERFAPGYDRYFFSIRSNKSWPGWAGFNGAKLCEVRKKKTVIVEEYKGVMENDCVFYVPRIKLPRFITRIETYILSVKLHWPIFTEEIRRQLNCPEIHVRETKIHRNSWGCVLNANVYLKPHSGNVTKDTIYKFKRKIICRALSLARRQTSWLKVLRFVPLGYAYICVFCKDYRRRHLLNYGLSQHLVCTIQLQRIKRIRNVDIAGSTVEQLGGYRIAWNRAWLEDNMDKA